jgi:iron(III) transport system substrate-binding protein
MHRTASLLAVAGFATFVFNNACEASDQALIDAARKEGGLTLYACDPPQTPLYVSKFQELYPQIKATSYVAGCWQAFNRHTAERQANRQVADVVFATEDVMIKMNNDKLLQAYKTPELTNFDAGAAPAGRDYLIVKTLIYGMTANQDYTKGEPLPKDWLDYINPPSAWQNQISYYDPRTSSAAFALLAALYQNFGADKTAAIYKGLISTHASLAPTTPAGLTKLLSGEQPIMFYVMNNHFSSVANKGASLKFVVPASGTAKLNFGIGITEGAPHPNAARLFVDFMMGEAQKIIQKNNEYSLRKDVSPPEGMPALKDLKVLPFDVEKALADQSQLLAWWQQTTGVK